MTSYLQLGLVLYSLTFCNVISQTYSPAAIQRFMEESLKVLVLNNKDNHITSPKKITLLDPPYFQDPKPKDLDPKQLRKLLGNDFDPRYMAITKTEMQARREQSSLTKLRSDTDAEQEVYRRHLVDSMPKEIKDLDFTMPGLRRTLGPRASKKLQLWLWKLSSCPVYWKWKDFGIRFWPRYRNTGRCGKKPSCSFPRGMKCKKAEIKQVKALKWVCFSTKPVTCKWKKTALAVVTKCQCTCAHSKS